ncbi:MAG: hypothetical protein E7507_06480 [Ruminococcus sp.]|nr:hypothetical protein [Ruminococcus sp.]
MKNFPNTIPEISIKKLDKELAPVVCEELGGWFIIPKLGERSDFAVYDTLSGDRIALIEAEATNKAIVHNTEGVEIAAKTLRADGSTVRNQIIAQLSDIRCGFLAFIEDAGDVKKYHTFYDDELAGFDVNEYGTETRISPETFATRDDNDNYAINFGKRRERAVVGNYEVTIDGKAIDTACVVLPDISSNRVLIEQYIDSNGRTVLQREFMDDDMMMENGMHIGFRSENYGLSNTIRINGNNYVCVAVSVTDSVL